MRPSVTAVVLAVLGIGFLPVVFGAEAGEKGKIPAEFIGKWELASELSKTKDGWQEGPGKPTSSELTVDADSIVWKRKAEGKEQVSAAQCSVEEKKVRFKATAIAYINTATGEKPRQELSLEMTRDGENLVLVAEGGKTQVPGTGFVVTSLARKYVFKRK